MLRHVLTVRCAPAVQVFQKMKAEPGGPEEVVAEGDVGEGV